MLIEAVECRVRYRLRDGQEVSLQPGVPTEVPDRAARQLLKKAADKVRVIDLDVIEPAVRPDGSPLRPVYWEGCGGRVYGPGYVTQVEKIHNRRTGTASFWLLVAYRGEPRWVRDDQLRSKAQYEVQGR